MLKNLTSSQQRILEFYRSQISEHGRAPSYPEAGKILDLSPSVIHYHVKHLETLGYLVKSNRSRGVQLVGTETQTVPLLGLVAGGEPITIFEECDEYIEAPRSMLKDGGNFYALTVRGMSMKNAGIVDGDIVLLRKQDDVSDGDIAVVAIGEPPFEAATLKRIFHQPSSLLLMPENDDFQPTVVKKGSVRGKLVGVIRNY